MTLDRFLELAPDPRPLNEGQKFTVFLSYRSVNRKWVISLYDALVRAGHKVFLDQKELVSGGKLRRTLEGAFDASAGGILIWSRAAADSEWVHDEYDAMQDRVKDGDGFCFVPVKLDNSQLPTFARAQLFVDFGAYPDGPNGGELLHLLHGLVGKPLSDEAMRFAEALSEEARDAEAEVTAAISTGDLEYLDELFEQDGLAWQVSPHLKARVVEGYARLGVTKEDMKKAIEKAQMLSEEFPKAIRPKQMHAHLLTRMQSPDTLKKGRRILASLHAKGERDPETLGLYAKAEYEAYLASGEDSSTRQSALLTKSRDLYKEGFDRARDTYCGINAAAKSLLIGGDQIRLGEAIAQEVAELLPKEISPSMGYWDAATVAEATLISGDPQKAARFYREAVALAPTEIGGHETTFRQVKSIAAAVSLSDEDYQDLQEVFAHLKS